MSFTQRSVLSCANSGDFVELLGGNGMDTSKMFPVADICYSFNGPGENFSFVILALRYIFSPRRTLKMFCHFSSTEGWMRQHGGQNGVEWKVRKSSQFPISATGTPRTSANEGQQR